MPTQIKTPEAGECKVGDAFLRFAGNRKFSTILADPPWQFQNRTGKMAPEHKRLARYPTLDLQEIKEIPVETVVEKTAHLYLWVPNALLAEGQQVMQEWGFTYKTNFVWVKPSIGLGQYFRGQHEICLFATKGRKPTQPKTDDKSIPSVVFANKGRHSAKPVESYELIEKRSHGQYLEIFARSNRDGWISWGNEV